MPGRPQVSVQAHLQDYSNPSVDGSYQADLSTWKLGNILKATSFPAGQVNLQGTLHYLNRADQSLLDNLALPDKFRSPALALNLPQGAASVRALSGEYRLGGGTLEVRNVQADVLGGRSVGELTLTHLSERPVARVSAAVRDVSLEAVSAPPDASQVERAAITGKLNGTVEGSWEGSGENLQLRSDATITASAPVEPGGRAGNKRHPATGRPAPGLRRPKRRDLAEPDRIHHAPHHPQLRRKHREAIEPEHPGAV